MPIQKEAPKNFELEWSKLTDRLVNREPGDYVARARELINKWSPGIRPEELERIMHGAMLAIYENGKKRSKVRPIPGVDPDRPN